MTSIFDTKLYKKQKQNFENLQLSQFLSHKPPSIFWFFFQKFPISCTRFNFELNGVKNVTIARMSSEEFSQALAGTREFRRLKDIDLSDYNFTTVLVDPPRAGLDNSTEKWLSHFEHILYISCNPDTLKSNLNILSRTHKVVRFALFDQFPYTHHAECGVYLQKLNTQVTL